MIDRKRLPGSDSLFYLIEVLILPPFFLKTNNRFLKYPDTNSSIPLPILLQYLVLYSLRLRRLLFYNLIMANF